MNGKRVPRQIAYVEGMHPVLFAEDSEREIFVADYDSGRLFRIDPAPPAAASAFPQKLSATGCVAGVCR